MEGWQEWVAFSDDDHSSGDSGSGGNGIAAPHQLQASDRSV